MTRNGRDQAPRYIQRPDGPRGHQAPPELHESQADFETNRVAGCPLWADRTFLRCSPNDGKQPLAGDGRRRKETQRSLPGPT